MKLFYQEIVKEQIFTMNIDRNQIWRAGSTVGQNKEKSSMHFNFEAMFKKNDTKYHQKPFEILWFCKLFLKLNLRHMMIFEVFSLVWLV